MKRTILAISAVAAITGLFAAPALPPAQESGGMPFREALKNRKTIRNYTGEQITPQQLSDLLYAAAGVNRPNEAKRTVPSAVNVQDILVYAALPDGVYLYHPETHSLELKAAGDHRADFGRQKEMFSKASVVLIYVSDLSKMKFTKDEDVRKNYAGIHAGFSAQNVGLFCASESLGNVVIGSFLPEAIEDTLKLDDDETPVMLVQLVGVPAK